MALNLQETELITTFDYGISQGDLITGCDYIWCINAKDNCLNIKSTRDTNETSLPYHDFGISSDEKFTILTGKDFEFVKQKYLLLAIEIFGTDTRNVLVIFKLSLSKVICAFQVPYKVTRLEILVKNFHFIENKNPSFFSNFDVSCIAACSGGAVMIFDITPNNNLFSLNSNEFTPSRVHWYEDGDITREQQIAVNQSKIFGFHLNKDALDNRNFSYMMPNNVATASLPIDLVKITSLRYEKQIDSLLIGFNFGCFQIWNMKNFSIESSSGYGENSKPVIGFSLLQPQNDPKKCLYLMVAHSRSVKETENRQNMTDDEFEIDDDDDESESSFFLMYQLIYERCFNVYLNQNETYMLYENINHCSVVFEHEFSLDTLKCVKTNSNTEFSTTLSELYNNDQIDSANSKIMSIQTISIVNNRLQLDLGCIIWALADKKSSSSDNFFLSVFNLNNWYVQCMPSKLRHMASRKNAYFTNYTLSINCDLDAIKFITLIDTKIRKVKNQNNLSVGNNLKKLLIEDYESSCDDTIGYDFDEETYLSMSFDLMMLTPFTLTKLSIKPIEHQIHQFISQQDDLIHYPEKVYFLLTRYHLIDRFIKNESQPKFIPIFNYLLETSQIYAILKSLWKLHSEDTSIISDLSLKSVLDWAWSKVISIKKELNNLNKKISIQNLIEKDNLSEFLNRENNLLDNLIQIFKQFLKLDTTQEGYAQLNKKLCVIESLKCYIEHLILFNKFELLLPATETDLNDSYSFFKNYLKEIETNFKIITNRWTTRRQSESKYPFTYMIDCLMEECKLFANTSKLFSKPKKHVKFSDEKVEVTNTYPPKSLLDLLEVCLECNLSTKMKQILILYTLCDLMHTEMSEPVKKHILKVINAYCSTAFTIMSTSLDAAISVPWSSSVTSIVSLSTDPDDPNHSSCLFDLVNGLYLIDSNFIERAFKYLRGIDVNYLEFYEKYFILYNTISLNEYKMSAQYLWLFQKLNASSIPTARFEETTRNSTQVESELHLFNFFTKNLNDLNSQEHQCKLKHEQVMHSRLILTIYLSNSLVSEAYDLIKPHLMHIKSGKHAPNKLSKDLLIHFFMESEKFKLWKHMLKLTSLDSDFLLLLLNYLEAKKDVDSIGRAIDLHINNRNYKKAIQLYEKNHQQISTSAEFSYLSSMIEIAKGTQNDFTVNSLTNDMYNLITPNDLKEVASFEYKFTIPLKELCKNSKRCLNLLNTIDDSDYIELLKIPEIDYTENSNLTTPSVKKMGLELTNIIPSDTPTRSILSSGIKKRKASTPHPNHIKHMIDLETPNEKQIPKPSFMSENKERILTSALKASKTVTQSVSKSVKFKSTRFTREFNNDNVFDREEVENNFVEEEENQENMPKRLEFEEEVDERSTMADSDFELKLEESTKVEEEKVSIDLDDMISSIPIMSKTDELRKSIFEKVSSSARKSIGEFASSITIEPIVQTALLHKSSTVKEFESPFKTENVFNLSTTKLSPIKVAERVDQTCESTVLNKEFIESQVEIIEDSGVQKIIPDSPVREETMNEVGENKIEEQQVVFEVNDEKMDESMNLGEEAKEIEASEQISEDKMDGSMNLEEDVKVTETPQVTPEPVTASVEHKMDASMNLGEEAKETETNQETLEPVVVSVEDNLDASMNLEEGAKETEASIETSEPVVETVEDKIDGSINFGEEVKVTETPQETLEPVTESVEDKMDRSINLEEEAKETETPQEAFESPDEKMDGSMNLEEKLKETVVESLEDKMESSMHLEEEALTTTVDNKNEKSVIFEEEVGSKSGIDKMEKSVSFLDEVRPDDGEKVSETIILDEPILQENCVSTSEPEVKEEIATQEIDCQTSLANEECDKTLEEPKSKDISSEDIDLNLSSVSNASNKASQDSITDRLILPEDPAPSLSRSSSISSLYSQISSVSEHGDENKRGLKRRAPVKTRPEEPKIEPRATKASLLRCRSEMPVEETRVTRGKTRASLEPEKKTVTRRNSKRDKLEQVDESEEISVANLNKHNLQMEKLLESETESRPKSARITRSKQRSPSPSASSIISCSSIASIESTSTVTSVKTRARKGKKSEETLDKTLKADESVEPKEQTSPTNSIASVSSVNSVASSRTTRRSTRHKKEVLEEEEEEAETKKYSLRRGGKKDEEEVEEAPKSVKKTTRTRSFRESKVEEPEKPKASVTRTRSLRSSVDSKTTSLELPEKVKSNLSKITEEMKADNKKDPKQPRVMLKKMDQK